MKLDDQKAERIINATMVLVALAIAIATFGAFFFMRWWLTGQWWI